MASTAHDITRNTRWMYVAYFFANSSFTLPIYILFGTQYLGVGYLHAGLLALVPWFVALFFDFLGGVVADRIGRKSAYVAGVSLEIVGILPFLFVQDYWLLLGCSVVAGLGMALKSNAIDALIYDQAAAADKKKLYQQATATSMIFVFLGRIYASIIGGIVYTMDPRAPYLLVVIALGLAVFAASRIRVARTIDISEHPRYRDIVGAALRLFRRSRSLLWFVGIGSLAMFYADMLFAYYQPLFMVQGVSPATLGWVFAGISVFSALGSLAMRMLPNVLSAHAIQSLIILGTVLTAVSLLVFDVPLALGAPIFLGFVSGFMYPNLRMFVNHHASSSSRAAAISVGTAIFGSGTGLGMLLAFFLAGRLTQAAILMLIIGGAAILLVANELRRISITET